MKSENGGLLRMPALKKVSYTFDAYLQQVLTKGLNGSKVTAYF